MNELIDSLFQHMEDSLKVEPFKDVQIIIPKTEFELGFQANQQVRDTHMATAMAKYDSIIKSIQTNKETLLPMLKQKLMLLKEKKVTAS